MQRIGILLIPLYDQLCIFRMEQIVAETFLTTQLGVRIHPVFKAFRDTQRDIMVLEKELGLERKINDKVEMPDDTELLNPNMM